MYLYNGYLYNGYQKYIYSIYIYAPDIYTTGIYTADICITDIYAPMVLPVQGAVFHPVPWHAAKLAHVLLARLAPGRLAGAGRCGLLLSGGSWPPEYNSPKVPECMTEGLFQNATDRFQWNITDEL
jgi:hypothetical protein